MLAKECARLHPISSDRHTVALGVTRTVPGSSQYLHWTARAALRPTPPLDQGRLAELRRLLGRWAIRRRPQGQWQMVPPGVVGAVRLVCGVLAWSRGGGSDDGEVLFRVWRDSSRRRQVLR